MTKLGKPKLHSRVAAATLIVLLSNAGCQPGNREVVNRQTNSESRAEPLVGVIVSADQVTDENLAQWRTKGISVALTLTADSNSNNERHAAESIRSNGLVLDYFVEVGRCPELAAAHPEWMASLQGHPEWRKLFPDAPIPTKRQVIKNFPWVPILYRESFDAHVARIQRLLAGKPNPRRIWLNDLQGAPSACGCGHPLCRWTADYGSIKTASPLDHHAAANFVRSISAVAGDAEIIPILVGECEADDKDTVCCGVECFEGRCWNDFTLQLDSLATESDRMGVACFYQLFERDLDRYEDPAGWVSFTLNSFSEMPRLRDGIGVTPDRLIAVLQGWDVSPSQIEFQIQQAKQAKAAGWLVCLTPIDQSWQPVVFDLPAKNEDVPTDTNTLGDDHQ
jgi:hypothetical protein